MQLKSAIQALAAVWLVLFVISFVNGLLNLFTLGIWFAWGRIRELRFLVGSTWVAGDPMSFHGRGGELFRGVASLFHQSADDLQRFGLVEPPALLDFLVRQRGLQHSERRE